MSVATATVQFTPLRNDLANLPGQLSNTLFNANIPPQGAVIELTRTRQGPKKLPPVFFGWTGLTAAKDSTIELDPTFAQNLGIAHGEKVTLRVVANAAHAHTVHLEPLTEADWEIVETHVAFLETFMINQVRALTVGQTIVVFPSPSSIASLKITELKPPALPGQAALLSPNSEVIVAPKVSTKASTEESVAVPGSSVPRTLSSTVIRASADLNSNDRALTIAGTLPNGFQSGNYVVVSLAAPALLTASSSTAAPDEPEIAPLKSIAALYTAQEGAISMSYGLCAALELHDDSAIGAKILVKQGGQALRKTSSKSQVTIRPYAVNVSSKVSTSKTALGAEEVKQLGLSLVAHGLVIPPIVPFLPHGGILEINGKDWGPASRFELGTELPVAESKKMTISGDGELLRPVVGQDSLIDEIVQAALSGNGTLLYGSRGSGKSVMLADALRILRAKSVRPVVFKCGAYADKAVSTVREALKKVANLAAWASPSVLVFDDVDKLVPAGQEHSGDSARQQQIAEVFCSICASVMAKGVALVATAQDKASVHAQLMNSHLLDKILHLRAPNKILRESILDAALEGLNLTRGAQFDMLEIVAETEGYQPGDLWILADRLSAILATDGSDEVTTEAFLSAAKDFVPESLRGVKLEKSKTKWADVGGMTNVKQVILETLDWPTKYAPVFANCPLRLRSGLLLYGYPGCGKTMLASAIATRTGLNFISVKGPEILNKYIGASEQSVRDLFDRAQAAKPCVLFFDEFDSIAPKRGHDSTGVTDRVVNQLLTQMDGAEGLDGVYVLAATSRPDMIDSALMRPGRLDKSLLCDMPNQQDRLDILRRAASTMQLDDEVNLDKIADETVGYTGADLQALMYGAYLKAVHKVLNRKEEAKPVQTLPNTSSIFQVKFESDESGNLTTRRLPSTLEDAERYMPAVPADSGQTSSSKQGGDVVIIEADDITASLSESKPSISANEVAKLRAIYAEFVADRNGDMPPGTSSNEVGGRVTLQ